MLTNFYGCGNAVASISCPPTVGGSSGGLGDGMQWAPITTQWSSLFDPDSRTSAFSNTSGVLSYTMAGDAIQYDGFEENGPGVEAHIQSLPGLETFDPSVSILCFYYDITGYPMAAGGDRYGLGISLLDNTLANRTTANGMGYSIERSNATTTTALSIEDTTLGAGGTNNLGDVDAAVYYFAFKPVPSTNIVTVVAQSWYRQAGTTTWDFGINTNGGTMSDDASTWYIASRIYHRSTVSATPTFEAKLYYAAYTPGADI